MDDKVMVGDYIGTIEEFMPGNGTYSDDGKIFASKVGVKVVDPSRHTAEIKGKELPRLAIDQIVFGEVVGFKTNMATVVVGKIQGQKGIIDERAFVYISNVSDSYVDRIEDFFSIGDIVKARVIRMESGMVDLSTKGQNGVVKAFCKSCRHPLVVSQKHNDKLECTFCSRIEKRKISPDFGKVSVF